MDGTDPSALAGFLGWVAENIVEALVIVVVGSSAMTALATRLLLGKKGVKQLNDAKDRISALESERETERENRIVTRAAYETRLSIVEAQLRAANQSDLAVVQHPPKDDPLPSIRDMWRSSPGSGRLTAKLVMMVPVLDEARDIFSAHRASPKRGDAALANWAFLYRLEDEGQGNEVFSTAYDFLQEEEDVDIDPSTQNEFIRLREEARRRDS